MREGALLETLHFNSISVDPFNITGNGLKHERRTNFADMPKTNPPLRVSMSVPITLSITDFTKKQIGSSKAVALVTQLGETVAILRDPEVYDNRKEEIVSRMFGGEKMPRSERRGLQRYANTYERASAPPAAENTSTQEYSQLVSNAMNNHPLLQLVSLVAIVVIDPGHPYISHIYSGGPYLLGGEVELLDRIRYNDGLDEWRKTTTELEEEFKAKGADVVYAFQTRNPTHAGHAYLMKSAGEDLKKKGYKKPVLWLSPLGGWTKSDDVPLDVRVKQHHEVLSAGTSHPGGLDPDTTVMAIWPSPMVYAGPTEVVFHAKSRRSAGASYFVVGRDPAGMKGSSLAVAHKDDDLYNGDHGRYVLQNSPGLGDMKMLSFVKVMYDVKTNEMTLPDPDRMEDFISISGTKMRTLARQQVRTLAKSSEGSYSCC